MLARGVKQAFYSFAGPLMKLNGRMYRTFRAPNAIKNAPVRLHLGPGQKAYLSGWIIY